jgi:23S rRNA pseudouridine1911/1915/1917 synthase
VPPPLLERVVGADDDGERVDRVVAAWLGEARARTQERVAAGEVRIDGEAVGKSARLRAGQRVTVASPPPAAEPDVPAPVPIRYEDGDLAIVAKPAGLVVHPGAGVRDGTLVDALQAMGMPLSPGPEEDRPGIVHRLDRGTSGLLVVAKTPAAREGLVALLSRRAVQREYWALVDGVPEPGRATIDAPITRSATRRTRFVVEAGGRPAITHYDVVADHGRAAELAVQLETGRTHQVRVHLAAIGHPVTGDRLYGASPLGTELGLDRPALHARRLAFDHPVTGTRVEVDEPLPADLERARAGLREAVP